jgi:ERCC4-type nuclease
VGFTIWVDTRERYPYRFTGREVETERVALGAGDYAVRTGGGVILAAVERKALEGLASSLSEGTLAFQMQRLSELPLLRSWSREGTQPFTSSSM